MTDGAGNGLTDREAALARFSALQQRARQAGLTLRAPPPEPTTCCGRGCNGCVWEAWYAAAAWWREEAETALAAALHPTTGKSPEFPETRLLSF